MNGTEMILLERQKQIQEKKFDAVHDSEHTNGELAQAAQCYIDIAAQQLQGMIPDAFHPFWPWGIDSWRPSNDPMKNIIKGAALAAAELDRLTRLKEQNGTR